MDKLPDEVLDIVFGNLHIFQKQECMLACRRWSNIIRSTSLFSTIHITKKTTFYRLIKVLDDNPSYRSQIQSLITCDNFYFTMHEKELLHYFPKVRFVHQGFFKLLLDKTSQPNKDLPANISNWRNQIEKMEVFWYSSGNNVLLLGVFSNLKKLVLNFSHNPLSFSDIISNAPNINSLVIINSRISLSDLESIHTGLKALQHLTLENMELVSGGQLNGSNATNSIITLFISFQFTTVATIVEWLQHITRTYTQLRRFKFIFPWASDVTSGHELYIIRNGLLPLLQNLGHQLNYIEINSSDEIITILNALSTLDNDKQIVHINTLFSATRKSFGQIPIFSLHGFIHQLTVNLNNVNSKTLSYLNCISTLKKLKIGYMYQGHNGNKRIFLNELLNSISVLLESLDIYDFDIDSYGTISRRHFLKELSIHSSSISQTVYQLISDSLPSLSRLTVDHHDAMNDNRIVLEEVDLQYLEVSLNRDCFILISTLDNRMSRYYRFGLYKPSDMYSSDLNSVESYAPINQTTFENIPNSERVLQLTCKCVKKIVVNKRLAL